MTDHYDDAIEHKGKIIAEGKQAQGLRVNPVFNAAFNAIKGGIINEFSRTEFAEVDKREHLHRLSKVVDRLESYFDRTVSAGKVAEKDLDDILIDREI